MQIFKSIQHFSGSDPCPGVDIEQIHPLSRRAHVLMLRNRSKPLLQDGFINIIGAIEMLGGMEYHHDNIVRISAELASGSIVDDINLFHEGVAYVNRLGQFWYFADSALAKGAIPCAKDCIPTIDKFMVFRKKYSAHRSIDAPRNESEDKLLLQAISFAPSVVKMMALKAGAPEILPPRRTMNSTEFQKWQMLQWRYRSISFQIFDSEKKEHINLTIEKEHSAIASEAYALLSSLILWEPRDDF